MNNCWYKLNIDMSYAFRQGWTFPEIYDEQYGWWLFKDLSDIFSKEWIDMMAEATLIVNSCIIFYREVGLERTFAHKDTDIPGIGFNWVIGGKDSCMVWYELPKELPIARSTRGNTPYLDWPISQLSEIERCNISNDLTMVRVDLPHTIIMGSEPRWCISIRINFSKDLEWNDIVNYMRSKNLLIERI